MRHAEISIHPSDPREITACKCHAETIGVSTADDIANVSKNGFSGEDAKRSHDSVEITPRKYQADTIGVSACDEITNASTNESSREITKRSHDSVGITTCNETSKRKFSKVTIANGIAISNGVT
jgi:hypothetical protein